MTKKPSPRALRPRYQGSSAHALLSVGRNGQIQPESQRQFVLPQSYHRRGRCHCWIVVSSSVFTSTENSRPPPRTGLLEPCQQLGELGFRHVEASNNLRIPPSSEHRGPTHKERPAPASRRQNLHNLLQIARIIGCNHTRALNVM